MDPSLPLKNLPGIGPYLARKLDRLEITTIEDLIYHFPFRYEDFSKIETARDVIPGQKISLAGVVWQIKNIRTRFGKFITRATVADQSGTVEVIWFNQPYLTKTIKAGTPISLSGKVEMEGSRLKMLSPSYEVIRNQIPPQKSSVKTDVGRAFPENNGLPATLHTGRLVPIYPETEGLTSKWLRTKIAGLLPVYLKTQKDFMPQDIIKRQKLTSLNSALLKIHFPQNFSQVEEARVRLSFDELFLMQFLAQKRRIQWQETKLAAKMKIEKQKLASFIKSLPFSLTSAQNRTAAEILADLQKSTPANRLLEGDVGSGKTVVAAIAAYFTFLNGLDTLFAAPTEILAFQHQKTLEKILTPFKIKVGIWTGSKKSQGDVTCGTHALLSTFKPKRKIGLVVVDEQHRFGVAQRAKLFMTHGSSLTPHLLTMTATPIPRTLALTLYGDLDLSVLDEMPKGRQKIKTFLVPNSKRSGAYQFMQEQIEKGRQAFIITPFVEPSETMVSVRSAQEEFKKVKPKFPKSTKLGLLHGRLKSKEKEKIIGDFKSNKIDVLVATPVVEVGIDVPNATVMMVESSDRFGLAALHQLRGRVGRGEHQSYCLLFTDSRSENSTKRLKSMEKIYLGFELAEIDLKMRGPGEIFGLKQSGYENLKIADLSDAAAISQAQSEAKSLIENDPQLKNYPLLAKKIKNLTLEYAQPN